jgi:hypothetical protein
MTRHPPCGAKSPVPIIPSEVANKVVPSEKCSTGPVYYSCLRDSDEMVFTDPSGNTDQGV